MCPGPACGRFRTRSEAQSLRARVIWRVFAHRVCGRPRRGIARFTHGRPARGFHCPQALQRKIRGFEAGGGARASSRRSFCAAPALQPWRWPRRLRPRGPRRRVSRSEVPKHLGTGGTPRCTRRFVLLARCPPQERFRGRAVQPDWRRACRQYSELSIAVLPRASDTPGSRRSCRRPKARESRRGPGGCLRCADHASSETGGASFALPRAR